MSTATSWIEAEQMARATLPLRSLLSQHGDGPASGGNWGSFKCPFCQKPGKKKSDRKSVG